MKRCLELAKKGLGNVSPNPLVGCVIVHDDKIIGEGYHIKYGQAHAEVNAINAVKDKSVLKHAALYVNLEPCSHYGKTPPCADLIVKHKIPKVFIGCVDSNIKVSGKGISTLEAGACHVTLGVLEEESRFINRRFFTFHEKRRPYIILKWAQTQDGFIDILRSENTPNSPNWITAEETRCLVHKWRTEEDAIMIGTKTAIADNPALTAREWHGKNPARIVIDRNMKLPNNLNIFNIDARTIVFNCLENKKYKNIDFVKVEFNDSLIDEICTYLYEQNIQSVIIEGGAMLLNSFIAGNLWDEARIFYGKKTFKLGLKAPEIYGYTLKNQKCGNDRLEVIINK
ncbi:MAG: bifunctional diaminohydroxyphosphoribosylaminopyrimidine deaminase/5-amino-6-(5-phosphoribosylamino)uracil reductase RibD [Bacteroidales bacterium]|nr:bifunctional diaminohydroxyphosphoribosylaminopyrimidine deaminase/5-amino-6-(5-phosphoribosylamino)uracil reductase RibD [Bacteroidales bacterium]